jgi:hypothetical protein
MTKITSQVASVLDSAYTPVIAGWPQNPQMLLIPDKLLPSCSSAMILRILDLWLNYLTWQWLGQCSFTNSETNLVPHFTRAVRSRVCKISKQCAGLLGLLVNVYLESAEVKHIWWHKQKNLTIWVEMHFLQANTWWNLFSVWLRVGKRLFQPYCTQVWNRCISDDWPHNLLCWVRVIHMHDR